MDFEISTTNLAIIFFVFFALVAIIFIFRKVIRVIFGLVLLAGLLYYVFIFSNIFRSPQEHAKYSIEVIKQKYCEQMQTHEDSVKCLYVITPIYNDIKGRYTEEQLLNYEKKPLEYYQILNTSMKRNKKQIIKDLTRQKEKQLWSSFVRELKNNFKNIEQSQ